MVRGITVVGVEGFLKGRSFTDKRNDLQLLIKPECELYFDEIAEYFSKVVRIFDDRTITPSYVLTPSGLYWRRIRGGNMWKRGRSRRK